MKRPLRVIELITLLVIAGLLIAVALPRCQHGAALTPTNQQASPSSERAP